MRAVALRTSRRGLRVAACACATSRRGLRVAAVGKPRAATRFARRATTTRGTAATARGSGAPTRGTTTVGVWRPSGRTCGFKTPSRQCTVEGSSRAEPSPRNRWSAGREARFRGDGSATRRADNVVDDPQWATCSRRDRAAATPRPPAGSSVERSRRRRGCHMDSPWTKDDRRARRRFRRRRATPRAPS